MKSLVIAAVSSAALLMGASAGFASSHPAESLTADHTAGYSQLAAGGTNNDKFRCLEGQNSGRSFDPNLAFCTT